MTRVPVLTAFFILIATCFCPVFALSALDSSNVRGKLKIAATIFPLADIVKQIAGQKAQVITLLPPSADPHTFELTPRKIKELEGSRAVFMIGHGLDDWLLAATESLGELEIRTVDKGIDFISPSRADPHYWLSITNAKKIAKNIAHVLMELDEHQKTTYQANLDRYLTQLDEADQEIKGIFSSLPVKKIITFHDGWRYFAEAYGLEILGTVEASEGGEPTPKRLAEFQDLVSRNGVNVLFSEASISKDVAKTLADDLNLELYELDPFGGTKDQERTYLELMLSNARLIEKALVSNKTVIARSPVGATKQSPSSEIASASLRTAASQ